MVLLWVCAVLFVLHTEHWGRSRAAIRSNEVFEAQMQDPLTNGRIYMNNYTPVFSPLHPLLLFSSDTKRLLADHGPRQELRLAADAAAAHHNKAPHHNKEGSEALSRKARMAVDSPLEKGQRGTGEPHHSKPRGEHSQGRYRGWRPVKPQRDKRENNGGGITPLDWSPRIHSPQPADYSPRGYSNPHIPAFVPQGSGILSFMHDSPIPPYAPSIPGYFPRRTYYPSYHPGFGPGVPYHPGSGPGVPNHPGWVENPHHQPTLGTTTTTQKPSRRTSRPKPPRRKTTPFVRHFTTNTPRALTEAPVTRPTPPHPVATTPTEVPDLASMSTYVSEIFTATVPVFATFPNGEPITANAEAETIPPLVRINRSDNLRKQ